jgi:UDP-2-acetamido-2,6-beta-L-arabino-hexul-4-ose reductase
MDNPYGRSKKEAERILECFTEDSGSECVVYRLKNLFGKWCKPNYNAVTATFCHNIAHSLPIHISDPNRSIELTYIDDVVRAFLKEMDNLNPGFHYAPELPFREITLGDLTRKIGTFRNLRTELVLPDFSDEFERNLYATYLSYLDEDNFDYSLGIKSDPRGSLAEFLKSSSAGQIFISRTRPGIVRGNHYHHSKTEKFLVVQGKAQIRFRHIERDEVTIYNVFGEDYRVLDIPPGYTHCIENTGETELVTLFWASEVFDPGNMDTYYMEVDKKK